MKKKSHKHLLVLASALLGATFSAHAVDKLTIGTGITYLTGKFGGNQSTDIVYAPVTIKYKTGLWKFGVAIPHLEITGPGNVLPGIGAVNTGTNNRNKESGLGDVTASVGYSAYYNADSHVLVNITGRVKFGTASENKNLGTGKNDYSLETNIYKTIDNVTPFITLGYKVTGDPQKYSLNDVFYTKLGVSYKVDDASNVGLSTSFKQKSRSSNESRKEVTAFMSHKLNKKWQIQAYAIKGFSNASPSWGAGTDIAYSF